MKYLDKPEKILTTLDEKISFSSSTIQLCKRYLDSSLTKKFTNLSVEEIKQQKWQYKLHQKDRVGTAETIHNFTQILLKLHNVEQIEISKDELAIVEKANKMSSIELELELGMKMAKEQRVITNHLNEFYKRGQSESVTAR